MLALARAASWTSVLVDAMLAQRFCFWAFLAPVAIAAVLTIASPTARLAPKFADAVVALGGRHVGWPQSVTSGVDAVSWDCTHFSLSHTRDSNTFEHTPSLSHGFCYVSSSLSEMTSTFLLVPLVPCHPTASLALWTLYMRLSCTRRNFGNFVTNSRNVSLYFFRVPFGC